MCDCSLCYNDYLALRCSVYVYFKAMVYYVTQIVFRGLGMFLTVSYNLCVCFLYRLCEACDSSPTVPQCGLQCLCQADEGHGGR